MRLAIYTQHDAYMSGGSLVFLGIEAMDIKVFYKIIGGDYEVTHFESGLRVLHTLNSVRNSLSFYFKVSFFNNKGEGGTNRKNFIAFHILGRRIYFLTHLYNKTAVLLKLG